MSARATYTGFNAVAVAITIKRRDTPPAAMQGAYSYASRADCLSQPRLRLRKVARPFAKVLISLINYFVRLVNANHGQTPFELFALLLFALPLLFTLQKFVELPELGERNHGKIRHATYYQKTIFSSL